VRRLQDKLLDWFEFSGLKCKFRGYHTPDVGTIHLNCTTCYRECDANK